MTFGVPTALLTVVLIDVIFPVLLGWGPSHTSLTGAMVFALIMSLLCAAILPSVVESQRDGENGAV